MYLRDALLRDLLALVGEECWGVVGGEGTGSVISLSVGTQILRQKPVGNPHLSDLVRQYDSAYSLLLWCPWRIDSDSRVVSGSHMSNANNGPMVVGSNCICGQKITAVTCSGPAFDLRLDFENQHALVVHCSAIGKDYEECYAFGTPLGHYSVSLDGELTFQSRQ
jgi:hypothetical protein